MDALGVVLAGTSALAAACAGLVATSGRGRLTRSVGGGGVAGRLRARAEALGPVRRAREAERRALRRSACLGELPVMLDVVTLGLSAGLSFDASLELYCERCDTELSHALLEAMLSWRMGVRGREEALWELADDLGVTALGRFASTVGEALSLGVPLSETLARQAQVIRDEQRSQVEEQIERVPVKMLVPLGVLIVPAMFLAILGPLVGAAVVVG
ncbi:type II secretion system F family protein [Thermophilibacter sp.]